MYVLRFDGLYREVAGTESSANEAGLLCYGWLIWKKDTIVAQGHGACVRCWNASSNVAEYVALLEGLDALADMGIVNEPIKVFGDAKTVIDQMNGTAGISSDSIWPLYLRARRLAKRFRRLKWIWRPRKENKEADWLTRRAMHQVRLDQNSYQSALRQIATQNGKRRRSTRLLPLIDLRVYLPEPAA